MERVFPLLRDLSRETAFVVPCTPLNAMLAAAILRNADDRAQLVFVASLLQAGGCERDLRGRQLIFLRPGDLLPNLFSGERRKRRKKCELELYLFSRCCDAMRQSGAKIAGIINRNERQSWRTVLAHARIAQEELLIQPGFPRGTLVTADAVSQMIPQRDAETLYLLRHAGDAEFGLETQLETDLAAALGSNGQCLEQRMQQLTLILMEGGNPMDDVDVRDWVNARA